MTAWKKVNRNAAIAAGRDPGLLPRGELWPGKVVEVEPTGPTSGRVVWEWRAFDHLIQDHDPGKANYGLVGGRPERIDVNHVINGGVADWLHINAIAYHPALDQIVLSVRSFSEIWIIDHSTTTAEAATGVGGRSGKGGDLLYRWGNPRTYRAGTEADRTLFPRVGSTGARVVLRRHPEDERLLRVRLGGGAAAERQHGRGPGHPVAGAAQSRPLGGLRLPLDALRGGSEGLPPPVRARGPLLRQHVANGGWRSRVGVLTQACRSDSR